MKKLLLLVFAVVVLAGCSSDDFKIQANASFKSVIESSSVMPMTEDGVAHLKITPEAHLDFALDSGSDRDVYMAFMAQPFLDAGLDVTKLPSSVFLNGDMLVYTFDLKASKAGTDAVTQLSNILDVNRDKLTYHKELDHYGLKLGLNKFEWAKDPLTNDKDAVFVLDGASLISWGVDLDLVEGWVVSEMDGEALLLLPINLK